MLPVGIFGVLQYYKQGHVDFKVVGILAVGFLAGSYFGSKIALSLPQETVKKIFAVLMIVIAIKMLFFDKPKKQMMKQTATKNKRTFKPGISKPETAVMMADVKNIFL